MECQQKACFPKILKSTPCFCANLLRQTPTKNGRQLRRHRALSVVHNAGVAYDLPWFPAPWPLEAYLGVESAWRIIPGAY